MDTATSLPDLSGDTIYFVLTHCADMTHDSISGPVSVTFVVDLNPPVPSSPSPPPDASALPTGVYLAKADLENGTSRWTKFMLVK